MKRKYYLIDTENVGDRWFNLLQKMNKKDRIITFYTKNHSKHLEKYMMKHIHNPKILWLECTVGNNALDYQLIGVLSYLIAKHPNSSYYIYSNDKDFQTTIDFWQNRGVQVHQKGYAVEDKKKEKKKKGNKAEEVQNRNRASEISSPQNAVITASLDMENLYHGKLTEQQYVAEIAKSLPMTNLEGWHQALTAVLGQETGRSWYIKIRDDVKLRETLSKNCMEDKYLRGVYLVAILLSIHDLDVTQAEEAYKVIQSHNRKNLKAIKADFDKVFGKKPQQKYYTALRPLIKILKGKSNTPQQANWNNQ